MESSIKLGLSSLSEETQTRIDMPDQSHGHGVAAANHSERSPVPGLYFRSYSRSLGITKRPVRFILQTFPQPDKGGLVDLYEAAAEVLTS